MCIASCNYIHYAKSTFDNESTCSDFPEFTNAYNPPTLSYMGRLFINVVLIVVNYLIETLPFVMHGCCGNVKG